MGSVGVFDSGVGGLSVLAEFRKRAPEHPVVYLADQAWAPYGERSLTEVRRRSVAITRLLVAEGCDVIVVACNSASAAALHYLREVFPEITFVGMEPAVKPAASQSERGVIGVLATNATFQGELYASVVDRHANGTEVVEQACPGLADAVERLGVDAQATIELLTAYLSPLRDAGIDTLVLGCTHYPFLLPTIERLMGDDIAIVDPAPAVARQTVRMLGDVELGGSTQFLTTSDPGIFAKQIRRLIGLSAVTSSVEVPDDFPGALTAVTGDLTAQAVDAIVNAANDHLQHGGGVAAAIVRAGGHVIQQESDEWIRRHGPLRSGEAAVTTAGSMPAKHVVHVAGPIYRPGQDNAGLLRAAVLAALDAADTVGADSIAFPAISAGIYGYPLAEATAVLADTAAGWLTDHPGTIEKVLLVGFNEDVTAHFARAIARHSRSG